MWYNRFAKEETVLSFAEKLRELRKQKNLTQENLANEILVSRTLITKYESGAVYPTEENLKRLADYFAVTTDELMSNEEKISATVKSSLKTLWISLTAVAIIISLTLALLLVLPVFGYVYNEGGFSSTFVYGTVSLLSAHFRDKSSLGIISFVLSLLCSVYSVFLLFASNFKCEKVLRISGAVLFGITVCLFVLTFVYGVKIIDSGYFHLNYR